MNKQPFYCTAEILFVATREIPEEEMAPVLEAVRKIPGVIEARGGTVLENFDCEAGDPADLL